MTALPHHLAPPQLADRLHAITALWDTLAAGAWEACAAQSLAARIAAFAQDSRAYGFASFRVDLAHLEQILGRAAQINCPLAAGEVKFVSQTLAMICATITALATPDTAVCDSPSAQPAATCKACRLALVCAQALERTV